ncbi:MAG: hypothetical protein HON23_02310 [Rickettsiales bacterium]|nr:hypothetical protein [Rickettsiales bacterium]
MPFQDDQYRRVHIVQGFASVLFSEIALFSILGEGQEDLKGYLGFRILDALYKFDSSPQDTKFSDDNYELLFKGGQIVSREVINGLRNSMLYNNKMEIDGAFINNITELLEKIKLVSAIDGFIVVGEIAQVNYQAAHQATKSYSQFLSEQKTRFGLASGLNSSETLSALKEKGIDLVGKIRDAKEIIKSIGVNAPINVPRISELVSELNALRTRLVHRVPSSHVSNAVSEGLGRLNVRLVQVHECLEKTPEQIAGETIESTRQKLAAQNIADATSAMVEASVQDDGRQDSVELRETREYRGAEERAPDQRGDELDMLKNEIREKRGQIQDIKEVFTDRTRSELGEPAAML